MSLPALHLQKQVAKRESPHSWCGSVQTDGEKHLPPIWVPSQPAHLPEMTQSTAGDPGGWGALLVAGLPCTGPTYHHHHSPARVHLRLPTRTYTALLQIVRVLPTRMSTHSRCNHSHAPQHGPNLPHTPSYLPAHLGLQASSPGSPVSEAPLCVPPQPTHNNTQGPVFPASGGDPPETPGRYPYLRPSAASASGAESEAASC